MIISSIVSVYLQSGYNHCPYSILSIHVAVRLLVCKRIRQRLTSLLHASTSTDLPRRFYFLRFITIKIQTEFVDGPQYIEYVCFLQAPLLVQDSRESGLVSGKKTDDWHWHSRDPVGLSVKEKELQKGETKFQYYIIIP